MKKLAPITAIPVALLALTACGQSPEDEFLEGMGCEDGQTAEECGQAMADDMDPVPGHDIEDSDVWVGEGDMPPQYEGISEGMTSVDRTYTGRMSGNVTAKVGDPVELDMGSSTNGYGNYVGTVALDSVEYADSCETTFDDAVPAHGHLLIAEFTLSSDDAAEDEWSLSSGDFRWDGFDSHVDTYSAFECEQTFGGTNDQLRPGDEFTRTMVFDVPDTEGTLSYRGGSFDVNWSIP